METTKLIESRIVQILSQQEAGVSVADICREYGISEATFYNWKVRYGGMNVKEVESMKKVEETNEKLKIRLYAQFSIFYQCLAGHYQDRMLAG